jgi:Na+/proline symporter
MNFSMASLVWGVLFGAIGAGYFIYGKRQQEAVPMLCGAGLMVFPYFVSSTVMLVIVGAILMAIPFLFRD